jgi:hypothetical protein
LQHQTAFGGPLVHVRQIFSCPDGIDDPRKQLVFVVSEFGKGFAPVWFASLRPNGLYRKMPVVESLGTPERGMLA